MGNSIRKFVLIESLSSDVASLDLEFRTQQELVGGCLCDRCHALKPKIEDIGTMLVHGVISDAPFGLIVNGLGIARKDFIFILGEDIAEKYFFIGKVANYKGKIMDGWVTFHARNRFLVRAGKEHASHRYCEECGRLFYFAMGKPYLYPEPPGGVEIYGVEGAVSFFLTEELAKKIKNVVKEKNWRKVKFTELSILNSPIDGLVI